MIRGLNHITLAVADLDRAVRFYSTVLGLRVEKKWRAGAYLSAGDLWLCLSLDSTTTPRSDYTHIALDISEDVFADAAKLIRRSGGPIWKQNRSEGASLYFCDPDGHQLELHVGTLASRLTAINEVQETC